MRRTKPLAILIILLTYALISCGASDSSSGEGESTDTSVNTVNDTVDVAADTGTEQGDSSANPDGSPTNPTADTDGDGIPDGVEYRAGLDWQDPDTDDDGLCDGSESVPPICIGGEDLNNNGRVDEGEVNDPRLADSDGDGICDGCPGEVLPMVCNANTLHSISTVNGSVAESALALPADFNSGAIPEAHALAFSKASAGIYGYLVTVPQFEEPLGVGHQGIIVRISQSNKRTNAIATLFNTWLAADDPMPNALRTKGNFEYGPESNNPSLSTKDPAQLRDEIIGAIAEVDGISLGESSTACSNIIHYHVTELRTNKDGSHSLVALGALVCAENFGPEASIFFDDLLTGTMVAPALPGWAYQPDLFTCDEIPASATGGVVDFIWIVDNSGSMSDEQDNVAATADLFLNRLRASTTDWRLAVTTTDAYCLDNGDASCLAKLNDDPLRTSCKVLRGSGFLSSMTPNVNEQFRRYVTENTRCAGDPDQGVPPGLNVCGYALESGLETAKTVMSHLIAGDPNCPDTPAFHLREDAQTVVIWVSDEEDQQMKDSESNILSSDDPTRINLTQNYIDLFQNTYPIRAYAIVGDAGKDNGGVCDFLEPNGVEGAEYGLGYIDVATGTGGASGSVCSNDLSMTIDTIIKDTIGQVSSYPLSEAPIVSSIQVATGGVIIPRYDMGDGRGHWEYVPEENAITFYGVTLTEGQPIAVAYKSWKFLNG